MTGGHPLDIATRLVPVGDDRFSGHTSEHYWNFAGPFGGITAAILLRAVVDHPRRLGSPVALTVNFCAAIARGAFELVVSEQRSGKSTQHWSVTLLQGGLVAATASVVCGVRRSTWAHAHARPPVVPPADAVPPVVFSLPSNWLQRYRFRFVEGTPAISATPHDVPADPRSILWLSDLPDRPLDVVSLAAMADAFLLRLLQVRGMFIPSSTVSLTTYFNGTDDEVRAQGTAPLCCVVDSRRFNGGFHDQTVELWGADGTLLASSVQVVWYKE